VDEDAICSVAVGPAPVIAKPQPVFASPATFSVSVWDEALMVPRYGGSLVLRELHPPAGM
jgi:hypothetical protein